MQQKACNVIFSYLQTTEIYNNKKKDIYAGRAVYKRYCDQIKKKKLSFVLLCGCPVVSLSSPEKKLGRRFALYERPNDLPIGFQRPLKASGPFIVV